ncbi:hypothetical protein PRK78_003998 [Emydomyces testavorans]|uniref:Uncharacterized protein n=1 Tax=Emydomyces testavorans TaxID=2070801 RepID=A0AAF0DH95_9EURO|nr:hypothetical protein PRK78_003998 [Emydomyces testavorans]
MFAGSSESWSSSAETRTVTDGLTLNRTDVESQNPASPDVGDYLSIVHSLPSSRFVRSCSHKIQTVDATLFGFHTNITTQAEATMLWISNRGVHSFILPANLDVLEKNHPDLAVEFLCALPVLASFHPATTKTIRDLLDGSFAPRDILQLCDLAAIESGDRAEPSFLGVCARS